ncbi:hypothetical protein GHT06_012503 [Daphnia sinensis]|uniref:Uncharacterized protein n=1 Tax=Daphnia sinensis TaxID=1820382 RepID=A0AAD5KVS2_9CRUS|nr:hypothetical protein GHT06_012503 [Daphnia sinensis]
MYKSMTLLVLVALAASVVSMETQDQEAAEQYYRVHGFYPAWYTYSTPAYTAVKSYPYVTYAGYPAAYPAGVKNVIAPYYAAYPYGYQAYPYAAPYTFYSTPVAPYVAPAAPEAPAKV